YLSAEQPYQNYSTIRDRKKAWDQSTDARRSIERSGRRSPRRVTQNNLGTEEGCVAKNRCLLSMMVDCPDPESYSEVCLWLKPISSMRWIWNRQTSRARARRRGNYSRQSKNSISTSSGIEPSSRTMASVTATARGSARVLSNRQ